MSKLKTLLGLLIEGEPLPASYLDHPLKGDWKGFRDAHIEPDWLLIYKIMGDVVRFERTGRHVDFVRRILSAPKYVNNHPGHS